MEESAEDAESAVVLRAAEEVVLKDEPEVEELLSPVEGVGFGAISFEVLAVDVPF
jgi:hypothetical protein